MQLPTPSNADSPVQKKHREQAIVLGTLVLIILTFMLVARRGQGGGNGGVASDASGFSPSEAGGGSGSDMGALPLMVGGVPGQVDALEAGRFAGITSQLAKLGRQNTRLRKREDRLQARNARLQHRLNAQHPHAHKHPQAPKHDVPKSHHSPMQQTYGWAHVPLHPPQHGTGRKAPKHPAAQHVTYGNLTTLKRHA